MQSPLDMHQGKCLYIYKMLSMRKSGIWKHWEFLRRPKMWQNGSTALWSWRRRFQWIPVTLTVQDTMNKKLRICLDPRDLNEALEREPYYTHSIEEIMGKFHGMTRFTIADFNKGYWMVELDPESRKYTMMALDIGRFQWTRLPMGSIVAQRHLSEEIRCNFP